MANEQKAAASPVVLRDRFAILPGSPLPEFATPTAQAYIVEDRRDPSKPYFALIVRPGFPARINAMRALKGVECPGMMLLVEWGVVDWPPAGRRVMAVVYQRPGGGRVAASLTNEFRRLEDADAVKKVVNPMIAALKELRSHGVTHRAIRPTNMFWATAEKDRVVLGDCTTAPPAMDQPVLVEPVESALAQPAGRGNGIPADDVYAVGASLAILLLGRNPVAHLDDATIIRNKIVQGSYGVLVGDERLPLAMVEVLRGTLCDDSHERWNNESLDLWLSGRRLTPLLGKMEKRAGRAFVVNEKEYYSARELAIGLATGWDTASAAISDGKVELWLRRALDNKERANAVAMATGNAGSAVDKRMANDVLVAKICMILDGGAPIRYKGLAAMPDGFGWLLGMRMAEGGDVRLIAEALMREVPKAWFETREAYSPDNSMLDSLFRAQKGFLDKATIGNGIERVLYELLDAMPCLSPGTAEDYVLELRDLLPALNNAAKKADGKGWPVDRHVAAFIGARANFDIDRQMADLTMPSPERSVMGMLNLLAVIQWRLGQGGLYGLAAWAGGLVQPALDSFYNRDRRRSLEKEIPRMAREGSLVELSRLLDNPEERTADRMGYDQARAEWAHAQKEILDIQAGRLNNKDEAVETAQQVAALISVTVSFITVVLLLISKVF